MRILSSDDTIKLDEYKLDKAVKAGHFADALEETAMEKPIPEGIYNVLEAYRDTIDIDVRFNLKKPRGHIAKCLEDLAHKMFPKDKMVSVNIALGIVAIAKGGRVHYSIGKPFREDPYILYMDEDGNEKELDRFFYKYVIESISKKPFEYPFDEWSRDDYDDCIESFNGNVSKGEARFYEMAASSMGYYLGDGGGLADYLFFGKVD